MSRNLLIYLFGTLLLTVAVGVAMIGPGGWNWGMLVWVVTALLAYLLYGERRGHPVVLVAPFLALLALLFLQNAAMG